MIKDILGSAINKINKRHFKVFNPKIRVINQEVYDLSYSKKDTQPENNFVTYLISHYISELDKIDELTEEDDYTIYPQIQLYKKIIGLEKNRSFIEKFKLSERLYPDIVFHKEQNDNFPENQKLIVECKINRNLSYKDFEYDLVKLYIYCDEINFQNGLFIIANNSVDRIEKHLKKFKELYEIDLSKVEIWIKNYNETLEIKKCNE